MANALLVEFARQGIGVVDPRVGTVEGGIETGDLRRFGKGSVRAARRARPALKSPNIASTVSANAVLVGGPAPYRPRSDWRSYRVTVLPANRDLDGCSLESDPPGGEPFLFSDVPDSRSVIKPLRLVAKFQWRRPTAGLWVFKRHRDNGFFCGHLFLGSPLAIFFNFTVSGSRRRTTRPNLGSASSSRM